MKIWAFVVIAGCSGSGTGVEGSGKATSDVRPVAGFSAIDIAGPLDAEISFAAAQRVEIAGDDNLVPLVTTDVVTAADGDHLVIGTRQSVQPNLSLVANITVPQISAVTSSGSGKIAIHSVNNDSLSLGLSGSAVISADGTVSQLGIDLSGSGDIELDSVAAARASVTVTGGGNVVIDVSQALDVHVAGSGTITYRGDPTVTQDITGSGHLVKH